VGDHRRHVGTLSRVRDGCVWEDYRLKPILDWLIPKTEDTLVRGRAGLIVASCLGLAGALLALLLVWWISGDLQMVIVVGSLAFFLLLVGIAALARNARVVLAARLLVALLVLLITVDAAGFGLGSPAAASYFVPVVLAACSLGFSAGMGVALFGSVAVWLIAWGASAGWYRPLIPFEPFHLTFNAPLFTVLLLLVALIVGLWSRYTSRALGRYGGGRQ